MDRDELVGSTAQRVWQKRNSVPCPARMIPTDADLARWLDRCPADALQEASRRLAIVFDLWIRRNEGIREMRFVAHGVDRDPPRTLVLDDVDGNMVCGPALAVAEVRASSVVYRAKLKSPISFIVSQEDQVLDEPVRMELPVVEILDPIRVPEHRVDPVMTVDSLYEWLLLGRERESESRREGRKRESRDVTNPLMPLVEAWQADEVKRVSTRPDPLFPHLILWSKTREIDVVPMGLHPPRARFPGFGVDEEASVAAPDALLTIFDLGGGRSTSKGRGAPISLRTFFTVVLAAPNEFRSGLVNLPPMRFGQYLV